jgi:hypothetical protein
MISWSVFHDRSSETAEYSVEIEHALQKLIDGNEIR